MVKIVGATIALTLCLAGTWKTLQAVGRPNNRGLRLLSIFYLFLGTTTAVWSFPAFVDSHLAAVLGPSPNLFLRNILPIPALYAGLVFLFEAEGTARLRHTWLRLRLPLSIWAVISTAAWFLTPPGNRGDPLTEVTSTAHVVFWMVSLAGLGYFTTCLGAPVTYRLARQAPDRISQRSLYVAAVGFMICLPLFVAPRMAALLITLAGYSPSPGFERLGVVGLLGAMVLFVAGFGGPVVRAKLSALRLWIRHLILTRRMYPLWSAMSELADRYSLLRESGPGFPLSRVHYRFYRRVIECRDGLMLAARLTERPTSPTSVDEEAYVLLKVLDEALSSPASAEATGPARWVFASPAGRSVIDDASALVELTSALRRQQKAPSRGVAFAG